MSFPSGMGLAWLDRKEKAHGGLKTYREPIRVQVRLNTSLTLEEYVTRKGWVRARILRCPFHPQGGCGFHKNGYYGRITPVSLKIARMYCPSSQATVGLIPDFLASRVSGTLQAMEDAVVTYESMGSISLAADAVRPPGMVDEDEEPITLEATARWLRRRVKWITATLITVTGLFPDLFVGVSPTVQSFRGHLGTDSVMMELRGICSDRLSHLPYPLGFGHRSKSGKSRYIKDQQSMCPDRPP